MIDTDSGLRLAVRELGPHDEPYVLRSWLLTHRDSELGSRMDERSYYALHRPVVEALLRDPSVDRLVATPEDDDDMIAGFVVADPMGPVLHWLHVRGTFRGLGVARSLAAHVGIDRQTTTAVTHDSRDLRRAMRAGWPLVLRPELLRDVR